MNSAARGRDTREGLLEAGEIEFARYGYAGAHLQSIAEHVGVQKTALYYYFQGKSDLYTAVVQAMLETFDRVVGEALAQPGAHPERLEQVLAAVNGLMAERPRYARLLVRMFIDGAGVDYPRVAPTIERVIGRLLAFYREGIDTGAFARLSSRNLFLSLFGAALFHYAAPEFGARVLGVEDAFAPEVVAWRGDEVRRLLLHGVLPRPGGGGAEAPAPPGPPDAERGEEE